MPGHRRVEEGGKDGQILRESLVGADRWSGACDPHRRISGFGLPAADRRPCERYPPMGARLLGITWIGLLYYFNFGQTPTMPTIPAELKPGVSKYIAPKALFYFRWGAAMTVLSGLLLAWS